MQLETFGAGRIAFRFGIQKINLHVRGAGFEPKARVPVSGALDLCFIASVPLDDVIARLKRVDWPIVEGPVERTGAPQKIPSVYVRDPGLNLIEISELIRAPAHRRAVSRLRTRVCRPDHGAAACRADLPPKSDSRFPRSPIPDSRPMPRCR